MVIKNYSITLDTEIVEASRKIMNSQGKKLSPVINNLLNDWLKKQNTEEKHDNTE